MVWDKTKMARAKELAPKSVMTASLNEGVEVFALLADALEEIDRLVDENDSLRDDHDCTYKWMCAGMEISERTLKAEIDRLTKLAAAGSE